MYHFTIEHRPARMLVDCDALSRYNTMTSAWRDALPENTDKPSAALVILQIQHDHPIPRHYVPNLPQLPPVQLHGLALRTPAMPAKVNPHIKQSLIT